MCAYIICYVRTVNVLTFLMYISHFYLLPHSNFLTAPLPDLLVCMRFADGTFIIHIVSFHLGISSLNMYRCILKIPLNFRVQNEEY